MVCVTAEEDGYRPYSVGMLFPFTQSLLSLLLPEDAMDV